MPQPQRSGAASKAIRGTDAMTQQPTPPPALRTAMKRHLAARNDRAAAAMVARLEWAGISVLLLKGPATRDLLGNRERTSVDIDVLVPTHARRRAGAVLKLAGYRRRRGSHSETWTHPSQTTVDLHHSLPRVGVSPREAWRVLSHESRIIDVAGHPVRALNVPAGLVHLAIHATQDAATRPKADLAAALGRYDTTHWQDAARVARRLDVTPTVAWAICQVGGAPQVAALFGPAALAPNGISERGLVAYLRSSAHWTERVRRQLRLAENWALWQIGRARRLSNGQSAFYTRRGDRGRGLTGGP